MNLVQYIFCILFISLTVSGQSPVDSQKEAMKQFDWLMGEWQGEAITQMGPTIKDTVFMKENIKSNLGGTIITIEGIGSKNPDSDEIVHHAFAVISYDHNSKKYRWQSWRIPGGYFNEHEPKILENGFTWSMDTPRGTMKYTITKNDDGAWEEIGEFSKDGKTWRKFFEMFLKKIE